MPLLTSRRRSRGRRLFALGALLLGIFVAAAAGWLLFGRQTAAERTQTYAEAWARGDDRAAATMTDQPAAALRALRASRTGLDNARVRIVERTVDQDDDTAVARLEVRWQVPRIGSFSYATRIALARRDDGWKVRWRPGAVHPRLDGSTRLGTRVDVPSRGRILGRKRQPIVANRPVVDVAVRVDDVRAPGVTGRALARLAGVDARRVASAIRDAPRGSFVPVVSLRRRSFERVGERLRRVRGVSLAARRAPLAPTQTFARALLGTVAPATAEQVSGSRGAVRAGEEVGQGGLQARYQGRLAGTPTRAVVVRSISDGAVLDTLVVRRGRRPRTLSTTLDIETQRAAEAALGDDDGNAALVALLPGQGDILAVANRPASSTYGRARLGLYPPGSTFKVISTAALLRDGLRPGARVGCPPTRRVEGRKFRNFEGGAQGVVPFRTAFARSCNTAFVALADGLDRQTLPRVARDYGLGQKQRLGLPAADAKVPAPDGVVANAAAAIGQDRIVASPLAMAGVAGAVVAGRWRNPRLLTTDPRTAGRRIPAGETAQLRLLMREVIDSGTGSALAGVPAGPIGKSGTAEYGGGDPPATHAWFIAARGNLAVAVLVEGGRSGGEVAAPLVARFFDRLDAGVGTGARRVGF